LGFDAVVHAKGVVVLWRHALRLHPGKQGFQSRLVADELVHDALAGAGARDDVAALQDLEMAGRAGLGESHRAGEVRHTACASAQKLDEMKAGGFAYARHEVAR
jgi:hypothetical protein